MITNLILIGLGCCIIIPLWILIDKKEKKYTDDEVIELLDNFRNSNETDLIKWFNLNKK